MKIPALLIAVYTPVMLLIHVSTGKILRAWNEQPDSRISRWFTPRCALRVEGVFWLLALAAGPLWQSLVLKVLVAVFSAIHFAIWIAGEFRVDWKSDSAFATSPTWKRIIVIFDSVEALVLAVLGVVAVSYLIHPG